MVNDDADIVRVESRLFNRLAEGTELMSASASDSSSLSGSSSTDWREVMDGLGLPLSTDVRVSLGSHPLPSPVLSSWSTSFHSLPLSRAGNHILSACTSGPTLGSSDPLSQSTQFSVLVPFAVPRAEALRLSGRAELPYRAGISEHEGLGSS